jgi:hypothetical protein
MNPKNFLMTFVTSIKLKLMSFLRKITHFNLELKNLAIEMLSDR